jgi:intein/homing endonuclease
MEEEIRKLYASGYSAKRIAKELSCTTYKVRIALKDQIQLPNEDICKAIINDYMSNRLTIKSLVKKYKFDRSTLAAIFCQYNIEESRRKTKVDDSYFERIDTEHKAYWLGFLMADGYNNQKDGKIEITLKSSDRQMLDLFNNDIQSDYKISDKKIGAYNACRITVRSRQMSDNLAAHGCIQKKSLILKFPDIRDDLVPHFIRGYFDGDGSITSREKSYNFHIVGTKDFLEKCRGYIGLSNTKLDHKGESYDLRYGGRKNAETIYEYLYEAATIFLERKHTEFIKCKLPSQLKATEELG